MKKLDLRKTLGRLEKRLKSRFHRESSGHDIYHLKRVCNLALRIQKEEGGDREVIAIAALLHDVHRIIERKKGKFCPPKDSLPAIKKLCQEVGVPKKKIKKILHSIAFHEDYTFSGKGKKVDDIETLIVQDADNLDAMGAIGIARAFAFGGAHKMPLWLPELSFDRKTFNESKKDPSTIHNFYSKLLKLKENMNTKTTKITAAKREKTMKKFLREFFREWKGRD